MQKQLWKFRSRLKPMISKQQTLWTQWNLLETYLSLVTGKVNGLTNCRAGAMQNSSEKGKRDRKQNQQHRLTDSLANVFSCTGTSAPIIGLSILEWEKLKLLPESGIIFLLQALHIFKRKVTNLRHFPPHRVTKHVQLPRQDCWQSLAVA